MDSELDKPINDVFSEIYLSFTETFNYIKIVWFELNKHAVNVNSRSQKLKSFGSIKEKEYDAHNRLYYNKYNTNNETKYVKVFSDDINAQLLNILESIKRKHLDYNWSDVKNYLKSFWLKSRKTADLFNSLLPLNVTYISYKINNIYSTPPGSHIKTIDELKNLLIKRIDWDKLNEINFKLYNKDFVIDIRFERIGKFDTIIYGTFKVSVNESYRSNAYKRRIVPKQSITRTLSRSTKNFVEILEMKTTHSYIKKLYFHDVEVNVTKDINVKVTIDSLNMIETYLQLLQKIYNINKNFIHKKSSN